jgi:hypothetical protein
VAAEIVQRADRRPRPLPHPIANVFSLSVGLFAAYVMIGVEIYSAIVQASDPRT